MKILPKWKQTIRNVVRLLQKLLAVLDRLADQGNTLVVIEHNLDVIKCADWIIDLGPEGGDRGGTVVSAGTPEEIARCRASYAGRYLKPVLGPPRSARRPRRTGSARKVTAG